MKKLKNFEQGWGDYSMGFLNFFIFSSFKIGYK